MIFSTFDGNDVELRFREPREKSKDPQGVGMRASVMSYVG